MLANLKQHGTVFNLSDDQSFVDDLLSADIDPNLESTENLSSDVTFEDED